MSGANGVVAVQIPEETINEIRERADIVEVVSRFVDLRRAGVNYKGLCPFHEEKTPSLVVSPDKGIFHCFGCDQGGNVFTFVMEMEGLSFPEAVRSLGKHYGVEVTAGRDPGTSPSRNEMLYRINDFAARWYHRQLTDSDGGERARKYLTDRGIPRPAWSTFQLGYAGEDWDRFVRAAAGKGVPVEPLRELKLVVPRQKSTGYFDYFRRRLMFPVASPSGRVVGFGGRGMDSSVEPKYLNSIESVVYAKRKILFGLSVARDAIRRERSAILVEGYTDCISLYVNGFENVVASCGTAITADHAGLLRRLTRRVTLIPDADPAGIEAALAAGSILLAAGLDVGVVKLDAGMDPDDACRKLGAEEMTKKMAAALEYLEYLGYIMKERSMSPREKEGLIQRVMAGLAGSGDRLRRDVIVQDLARVFNVSPENLARPARAPRTAIEPSGPGAVAEQGVDGRRAKLEKLLLRLMLESTPESAQAREMVVADDFSHTRCREFYKLLDSAWENHIDSESSAFQQKAEKADLEGFAAEISLISVPPGNSGTLLKDTVKRVKQLQIRDELSVLREKLRELPEESEDAIAVAEHYARLRKALSEL